MNNRFCFTLILSICFEFASFHSAAGTETQNNWSSPLDVLLPSANGFTPAVVRTIAFSSPRNYDDYLNHHGFEWNIDADHYMNHYDYTSVIVPSMNLYWLGDSADQQMFANRTMRRQFFILGRSIVGVSSNQDDVFKFYVSTTKFFTTDPFREVDAIFREKLAHNVRIIWSDTDASFGLGGKDWNFKQIAFGMENVLGWFPFTGKSDSRGEPAPEITKIDVNSDSFTIGLAGGKNDSVAATITFNNKFKPMKATLRGKQVFPK